MAHQHPSRTGVALRSPEARWPVVPNTRPRPAVGVAARGRSRRAVRIGSHCGVSPCRTVSLLVQCWPAWFRSMLPATGSRCRPGAATPQPLRGHSERDGTPAEAEVPHVNLPDVLVGLLVPLSVQARMHCSRKRSTFTSSWFSLNTKTPQARNMEPSSFRQTSLKLSFTTPRFTTNVSLPLTMV